MSLDPSTGQRRASWSSPQALRRRRVRDVAAYLMAALGGVGLLIVLAVIYAQAGDGAAMIWPALLALVPLGIVLVAVRWIDRWEPEPVPNLLVAFLWGAGVATAHDDGGPGGLGLGGQWGPGGLDRLRAPDRGDD